MDHYRQLEAFIESHREDMLSMWADFVNTPSQARNRDAAWKMGDKLVSVFKDMGMEVAEYDAGPVNSRTIEAIWNKDLPGAPILFSGHYDTVNSSPVKDAKPGDPDEFDGTPHFRVDSEGKAYGLGALDMKGGIVIAIWVTKALQSIGWNERPIKFLWAGDEDKGHEGGNTPDLLMEHAKGALCCFNMETGRVNNDLCIGRKGGGQADLEVTGVGAHAGNDFQSGRNAVLEMAHKAIELAALTNVELGTTISPDVISGGTVPNGIPENCHLQVDVRYTRLEERDRVVEEMKKICAVPFIEGTTCALTYKEFMAPFATTPEGLRLADFVAAVSRDHGLGDMGQIFLGGGSDASYITIAGVPTVCSTGVRGQFNHTSKEYAEVESLYDRAKLFCAVVLNIQKFADGKYCDGY